MLLPLSPGRGPSMSPAWVPTAANEDIRIGLSHYHTTCTSDTPKSLSIPDPHPLSSCFSFILRVKLQVVFFIIVKKLKFF